MNPKLTLSACIILLLACGSRPEEIFISEDTARIFSHVWFPKNADSRFAASADPLSHEQWHFMNTGQVSSKGIRGTPGADIRPEDNTDSTVDQGEDVVVAIIDSGIEHTHADLDRARLAYNPGESGLDENGKSRADNGKDDDHNGLVDDHLGWSFSENHSDTTDTLGHGTHVAGLMIARSKNTLGIGVPWNRFKILPLQIFSSKRPSPSSQMIAAAIRYAVVRGAKVISASFGSPSYSEQIKAAVEWARLNDVLLVSAVGNFRQNQDIEPSFPAGFNLENQISVGASERRDLVANFSSFGSKVDLFAPGEEILSLGLNGTYVVRSGTSQAAPLVAAAAATARQLFPKASAVEIKHLILDAADELPGLTHFSRTARRLNVKNIIHKRTGQRQKKFNFDEWKSHAVTLETEHPYRADLLMETVVSPPDGSQFFRLEFDNFSTQSSDILEILDADNRVITLLSGSLGSFWSPVFDSRGLTLRFSSDKYVSDYGWKIGRIQYTNQTDQLNSKNNIPEKNKAAPN